MLELLGSRGYLAERALATVTFLSLRMGRPLFLEGEAGVGKTEIAKVLSAALGRKLIRLQCYEGLDVASAVYEWNSAAQMIAIRLAEAGGDVDRDQLTSDILSAKVDGTLAGDELTASLSGDIPSLAAFSSGVDGRVSLTGSLSGPLANLKIDSAVTTEKIAAAGRSLENVDIVIGGQLDPAAPKASRQRQ